MIRTILAATLLLWGAGAQAGDFDFNGGSEQDFDAVMRDITAALGYKALHPAETGGIAGVELAAILSYAPTRESQAWRNTTGADVDTLGMVGLRAVKGLPLGFELGAFYSSIPGTGAELLGGEVRYALIDGGVATPAVSIRAAISQLSGVDDFDFEHRSLDISVSKGFALLTPYAGIGRVWGEGQRELPSRQRANHEDTRLFLGTRIGLGVLDITPEYERVGDNNVFNLLLGLSI